HLTASPAFLACRSGPRSRSVPAGRRKWSAPGAAGPPPPGNRPESQWPGAQAWGMIRRLTPTEAPDAGAPVFTTRMELRHAQTHFPHPARGAGPAERVVRPGQAEGV